MATNQASNDEELKEILKPALKYAVQILMERILEANHDAINKVVYYSVGTPRYYQNTYEFLDAWDIAVHSNNVASTGNIQGTMFYNPSNMKSVPPSIAPNGMGQHHGIGGQWGDSREYLAEIIYEGLSGPAYGDGDWQRKRNAYKELIKVVGKANFRKWMAEAMRDVGLQVQVHRTAINMMED